MKQFCWWISAFIFLLNPSFVQAQEKLMSPEEFLEYELGEGFTFHHQVLDYYKYVAANSPRVQLQEYGSTYENRPLVLAFISTEQNLKRKEEIRESNLKRAGILNGKEGKDETAIVWLSYNIHGNEAVSTESSMKVLYALACGEREEVKKWLQNTMIIIDPVLNPDGRERYINWYKSVAGRNPNPNPEAWEHQEPWPGGRPNHYLFDLNRDWAWQTQKESKHRMEVYNQWLPHIHADFHEQGIESPYYFAPAAEPFHEYITDWQREFQTTIGLNNTKYFDESYWLYFTREKFDLLYPSYGDTYPTFNGAVGMTFEQGGSGKAGISVTTTEGDTLTLKERVQHHYVASLATIESTSQNASSVVTNFHKFFQKAEKDPPGQFSTYIFPAQNGRDKINALRKFLDLHQIKYEEASQHRTVKGWSYLENQSSNFRINPGDLVINAKQPKAVLLQVLFEPTTKLKDSITYDITAWAVPYMMGMETYGTTEDIASRPWKENPAEEMSFPDENPYAYLLEWNSLEDVKFLSRLLKDKVKVRFAEERFETKSQSYQAGTLIITRRDNMGLGAEFDFIVREAAQEWERPLKAVKTGFVIEGKDFGSSSVRFMKKPSVAVIAGEGVSSLAFGEVWHFFEQQINYPLTVIGTGYAREVNWSNYDVLILPDGNYEGILDQKMFSTLSSWVRKGGKLIIMEGAIRAITNAGVDYFEVRQKQEQLAEAGIRLDLLRPYSNKEKDAIENYNPGSIFRVNLDSSHPLAFGYKGDYFSLKTDNVGYDFLQTGWNVGTIRNREALVSGFVGRNAQKYLTESLVFGVEEKGNGQIIYLVDNPLFRAFWHNGKLLFSNAVFMVGQ